MTNTNNGKITWKLLKPIIQGKILVGPKTDESKSIVSFANQTFEDMSRLRVFFKSLETSIKMLKTDKEFRSNFDNLLNLVKSPFVQAILGGSIDIQTIESVLNSIINDMQVSEAIETIGKIFDCFSVDRFVLVNDEEELENVAHELAKKKLFYAGLYFTNEGSGNDTSYKLRMEVDNTPVTIENRNRFWFPGAEGSFELEMRYHRGFIEIQNSIDTAIIKHKKQLIDSKTVLSEDLDFSDLDFNAEKEIRLRPADTSYEVDDELDRLKLNKNSQIDEDNSKSETTTLKQEINYADIFKTFQDKINISSTDVNKFSDDGDFWNFDDDDEVAEHDLKADTMSIMTFTQEEDMMNSTSKTRRKRQLESILGMLGFGSGSEKLKQIPLKFGVDDIKIYTKQFPYPR